MLLCQLFSQHLKASFNVRPSKGSNARLLESFLGNMDIVNPDSYICAYILVHRYNGAEIQRYACPGR